MSANDSVDRFSALQRAEIAEILLAEGRHNCAKKGFSALQRAEIAEIKEGGQQWRGLRSGFSALQRAEIAEIVEDEQSEQFVDRVFQCSSTSRNC